MDLHTVTGYRAAHDRVDLALAPGERLLAGGTWLFSEPQPGTTGLVDLTTLDWPALEFPDSGWAAGGLRIAATCTIAELVALPPRGGWHAHPLIRQCADVLLASSKVWQLATVGGNIARAYAAAGMVSLAVTLDARATVWTPDGGGYKTPVADLVAGNGVSTLRDGEVLRHVDLPAAALGARTALRTIALAELGRSGAVLTGRLDPDGAATFVITAATERPAVLTYRVLPTAAELRRDVDAIPTGDGGWYTDALGAADWRRAVSGVLLDEVRAELAAGAEGPAA